MRSLFLSLAFLLCGLGLRGQNPGMVPGTYETLFPLWNGFQLIIPVAERLSRLGTFIEPDKSAVPGSLVSRVSVAGKGKPSEAHMRTVQNIVHTSGVWLHYGTLSFQLKGKAKVDLAGTYTLRVPLSPEYFNLDQFVTLLNGFELKANGKPLPIEMLRVHIGSGAFDPVDSSVACDISVGANFGKAGLLGSKVNYELKVNYLMLGTTSRQAHQTPVNLKRGFFWSKVDTISADARPYDLYGVTDGTWPYGTVGVSSFQLAMVKPANLLDITFLLENPSYNSGKLTLTPRFELKTWNQNTPKRKRKAGAGEIRTDLYVLQFKQACLRPAITPEANIPVGSRASGPPEADTKWTEPNRCP